LNCDKKKADEAALSQSKTASKAAEQEWLREMEAVKAYQQAKTTQKMKDHSLAKMKQKEQ